MYPVRLGFEEAKSRINSLIKNGHHSEALVTAVFTVEKTLRRTLAQLIISAGFTSKQADALVKQMSGIASVQKHWKFYDPNGNSLVPYIIDHDKWNVLSMAFRKRNSLIHGTKVFPLNECRKDACEVLSVLDVVKSRLDHTYDYSGWSPRKSRRKPCLHKDPKVKIS